MSQFDKIVVVFGSVALLMACIVPVACFGWWLSTKLEGDDPGMPRFIAANMLSVFLCVIADLGLVALWILGLNLLVPD